MRLLSDIEKPQQSGSGGVLLPILGVGALAVAGYFGYKVYDKKREDKAIDEANKSALAHTMNQKRTEERIRKIEATTYIKGKNAQGKTVSANIATAVKEALNGFYIPLTDKYGTTKYIKRSEIDEAKIKTAIFYIPINAVGKFDKWYTAYSGKNFVNDAQQLSPSTYKQIKVIYEMANKYFPATFK